MPGAPGVGIGRRGPINNWTDAVGNGAVIAIDPRTGERKWKFEQFDVTDSGILTTASDLLFTGGREGYFYALDARTGKLLWKASLGGQIVDGADHLHGGRQAVRLGDLRQHARHVRPARLKRSTQRSQSSTAHCIDSAISAVSAFNRHSTTTAVPLTLTISMLPLPPTVS